MSGVDDRAEGAAGERPEGAVGADGSEEAAGADGSEEAAGAERADETAEGEESFEDQLRELFGELETAPVKQAPLSMADIAEIFGTRGPKANAAEPAPADMDAPTVVAETAPDAPTVVAEAVGEPLEAGPAQQGSAAAVATATREPQARESIAEFWHAHRTAILVAVAAVLAVVVGVVLTVVILANRSNSEALGRLEDAERALVARIAEVNGEIDAVTAVRDAATKTGESFAEPLAKMTGVSDDTARADAERARTKYLTDVAAVVVPARVEDYQRGAVDTGSAAALDAERAGLEAREAELATVAEQAASARVALDGAETAFTTSLSAFTHSLPGYAEIVVDENPDAEESFAQAAAAAAQAVAATDVLAADRVTVWNHYVVSIGALRGDQLRAEEEYRRWYEQQKPEPTPEPTPTPGPTPTPEPTPAPAPGATAPPAGG